MEDVNECASRAVCVCNVQVGGKPNERLAPAVERYREALRNKLNPRNLFFYARAYYECVPI